MTLPLPDRRRPLPSESSVLTRRNVIGILMSIELMFNAANVNSSSRPLPHPEGVAGRGYVLVITVAAAEVVVGLGLRLAIHRNSGTAYVSDFNLLKG